MTAVDVPVTARRWSPGLPGSWGLAVGGTVIGLLVLVAIAAPLLSPHEPTTIDLSQTLAGFSGDHLLGTDAAGRDVLSRLIYGTRLSLLGPLAVVLVSVVVGVPAGLVAGYRGGWVDSVLSRVSDMLFGFPPLLLAIVIVATFGAGFLTATIAIAITYIPLLTRVVRGVVMVECRSAYVDAYRIQGFSGTRVCLFHILPNVAGTIVAQSTLNFGYALLDLAGLTFLGLGVQPPTPDWGQLLSDGRQNILFSVTEVTVASIAIAIAVVAFNVLGDALAKRLVRGS
ncbi:ABC transporter permease [Candidatus Aeolococcus gillhamiae]|uniref:ABC transporter permease n=1 Tax=Candidatus Aeolococcus gillhamiae TaxID=3127015 RepID=UPI0030780F2E